MGKLIKYVKTKAYFRFITIFFLNQHFTVGTTLKNKDWHMRLNMLDF